MRIGIDASRLNLKEKTGTEWYSYYIVLNILNIDRENQYFLFSREKLSEEFLQYDNVKNIVLPWKFKRFWTILRLSIALLKNKVDLFFSPAHNLPICVSKKIITWHDICYEYYPEYYSKIQLLSLKLGALKLKTADAVITPSFFTKKDIVNKYNIDSSKIHVTHLGIDFNKYQKEFSDEYLNSLLKKHGIEQDYFLFIGRLEEKKNIEFMIDAYNIFRDNSKKEIDLVLIGKSAYKYENIEKKINESIYKNDIKVIGWVEEDEKICLMKNTKMYLNFSHFEGFGMTIIEAMFSKTLFLISSLDVFKELGVGEYCLCRNDTKDVAIKIDTLLLDENLKNDIINKNYIESQKYGWKRTAEETLRVFKSMKNV